MNRLIALLLALTLALTPLFALAEETDALMDFVQETLDKGGYELYERDDETNCFALGFGSTDNRLGNIYAYLDIYSYGVLFIRCYEQTLPAERIDEAIRFVNLVNSDLLFGKYYIDTATGDIFYEAFVRLDLVDVTKLDETVQDVLLDTLYMVALDANYDVEYFVTLSEGETAANVFAMYLADNE